MWNIFSMVTALEQQILNLCNQYSQHNKCVILDYKPKYNFLAVYVEIEGDRVFVFRMNTERHIVSFDGYKEDRIDDHTARRVVRELDSIIPSKKVIPGAQALQANLCIMRLCNILDKII
jgi:hypothetical protein